MRIGVALGSNLGDAARELRSAVAFLETIDPGLRVSSIYSSAPVDCPPGSGDFLNAVAELEWEGDLSGLLDRFQAHEKAAGRPETREVNAPRPIDLDLLYADQTVCRTPRLILPHPRLQDRLFVLMPLAEIAPDLVLPGFDRPVKTLLDELRRTAHGQVCHQREAMR